MTEPLEQRLWAMIDGLIEATQAGKVKWVPEGETQFFLNTDKGSLSIRSRDLDGAAPFVFSAYDTNDIVLAKVETVVSMYEPDFESKKLETLYDVARRQALKIDKTLDDIEKELGL